MSNNSRLQKLEVEDHQVHGEGAGRHLIASEAVRQRCMYCTQLTMQSERRCTADDSSRVRQVNKGGSVDHQASFDAKLGGRVWGRKVIIPARPSNWSGTDLPTTLAKTTMTRQAHRVHRHASYLHTARPNKAPAIPGYRSQSGAALESGPDGCSYSGLLSSGRHEEFPTWQLRCTLRTSHCSRQWIPAAPRDGRSARPPEDGFRQAGR